MYFKLFVVFGKYLLELAWGIMLLFILGAIIFKLSFFLLKCI